MEPMHSKPFDELSNGGNVWGHPTQTKRRVQYAARMECDKSHVLLFTLKQKLHMQRDVRGVTKSERSISLSLAMAVQRQVM